MSLRNTIIGTASALALAGFIASPACAMEGFNGLLGVDYSHLSVNQGGGDANDYGVAGSGMFTLGSPHFAVQLDAGYHHIDVSHGGSGNDWNVGGTGMWTGAMGRIGATVDYNGLNGGGTDGHATNYGGFGNWYAMDTLTVGLKGGGFSGSSSTKGDYFGAQLKGYITPNFSLAGGYDYTHLDHFGNENDWSARAEYLFSEQMPISGWVGYTNSKLSDGGPTINTIMVGLTFLCDPTGPESLEAHDRSGAERWGNNFGPALLKF